MSNSNQSSYDSHQSKHHSSRKQQSPDNDQPLKRSTYNIFEAYDIDMSACEGNSLLASSSIHPLQTQSPYAFDLHSQNQQPQGDLSTMMKDLSLSAPDKQRDTSMPYCV